MEKTVKTPQQSRVILRRDEIGNDEPYHNDPFINGIVERIWQHSPAESATVAGLIKLALRTDEIGEVVRENIIAAESFNANSVFSGMPDEEENEMHFWNGIISGLELADYRQQPKIA